jgi:(E)-4-hydroxy-3-methylbut-2-enyl-diphosphate synthase
VPLTIEAYRLAAETFPFPLHLGVTETGTEWNGTIQSAVGIGTLLSEGIGNTIRVSLTADPVREVSVGIAILKAAGLRKGGVKFVSCPTCGRTEIDLISLATETEKRVRNLDRDITVAVMGCVVNGPGEAREADYGIAGGKDRGILFCKGEVLGTYPYEELLDRLMDLING